MKKFLLGLLLGVIASAAMAHDAEYRVKRMCIEEGNGDDRVYRCYLAGEKIDVFVDVLPQDVGRKGAIYVAAQEPTNGEVVFLTKQGWTDGMSAYDFYETSQSLPPRLQLTIFQWQSQAILTSGNPFAEVTPTLCSQIRKYTEAADFWVGYGAVQQDAEDFIAKYQSIAVKDMPDEHFRIVHAFEDGRKGNKYARILKFNCGEGGGIEGWPVNAPSVRSGIDESRDMYKPALLPW